MKVISCGFCKEEIILDGRKLKGDPKKMQTVYCPECARAVIVSLKGKPYYKEKE